MNQMENLLDATGRAKYEAMLDGIKLQVRVARGKLRIVSDDQGNP